MSFYLKTNGAHPQSLSNPAPKNSPPKEKLQPFQASAEKYEGAQKNGMPHGLGILEKTNNYGQKETYLGYFEGGKKHGIGKQTIEGNGSYIGEFQDDKKHGVGKLDLDNSATYIGNFKDGQKHGYGITTDKEKGALYQFWKNGYLEADKPKAALTEFIALQDRWDNIEVKLQELQNPQNG